MSPALFSAIIEHQQKIKHNPFKSDGFSVGLVILEAGLLKPIQRIYSPNGIDMDAMLSLLEEFIHLYDNCIPLKEALLWLVDIDEKGRKDPSKVLQMLT